MPGPLRQGRVRVEYDLRPGAWGPWAPWGRSAAVAARFAQEPQAGASRKITCPTARQTDRHAIQNPGTLVTLVASSQELIHVIHAHVNQQQLESESEFREHPRPRPILICTHRHIWGPELAALPAPSRPAAQLKRGLAAPHRSTSQRPPAASRSQKLAAGQVAGQVVEQVVGGLGCLLGATLLRC